MDDRGADRPPYEPALVLGAWAWGIRGYVCGRVVLGGGDPDQLSLRHFLDVAHMLLVEQYVHVSSGRVPLSIAQKAADELLETDDWGENGSLPDLGGVPAPAENDAALADLMSKMGGIRG